MIRHPDEEEGGPGHEEEVVRDPHRIRALIVAVDKYNASTNAATT